MLAALLMFGCLPTLDLNARPETPDSRGPDVVNEETDTGSTDSPTVEDDDLFSEEGEFENVEDDEDDEDDEEVGYVEVGDCTFYVEENGEGYIDLRDQACAPATIHGEISSTGNDGSNWTGDLDFILITVPEDGEYTIALHWTAADSDYDLMVLDAYSLDVLDYSYFDEPEQISMWMVAGEPYYLVIGAWEGATGAWTVEID